MSLLHIQISPRSSFRFPLLFPSTLPVSSLSVGWIMLCGHEGQRHVLRDDKGKQETEPIGTHHHAYSLPLDIPLATFLCLVWPPSPSTTPTCIHPLIPVDSSIGRGSNGHEVSTEKPVTHMGWAQSSHIGQRWAPSFLLEKKIFRK